MKKQTKPMRVSTHAHSVILQILPSLRASRKTCVAIHKKKNKDIDCHESLRDSRNDEYGELLDCHANSLRSFARNDGIQAHNDEKYCHTERSEVSQAESNRDISLALNMTTRKSLNMTKNPNLQNPLDISVSTKPQYDNPIVIASKSQDLRGNPQIHTPLSSLRANEVNVAIQNQTRLTQKIDCHEFDKSNSRNDEISSYNVGIIDCHANSLRSFARNDGKAAHNDERLTHPQTPSAREGAFKVAPHTHNAKSANNDNLIVIASKSQDLRGNPQIHTPLSSLRASRKTCVAIQNQTRLAQKIDCHANSLRSFARNDERHARNDEKYCHTERSEVSKNANANLQNPLDISVSTKPQYDKANAGQYDTPHANQSKYTPHTSDKNTTTPTSRKLALSLLTASALGSASLELAIAGDCVILQHSSVAGATSKRVECTGSFSASEFQSKLESAGKSAQSGLFFIGTSGGGTSIGAGSVSINLANVGSAQYDYSFQFYGLNAPNTTFTFTGTHTGKTLGILMPYSEAGGSHGANGSTLFGLTLDTNVDYSSYGVANVYGKALGLSIHGGTQIGRVDERSGEYQGGLKINSGKTVNAMAIYGGFAGTDRSTFVSKIDNNGTIGELNLGWKEYAQDFASVLGLYNISGSGTITTLNVYQSTLTINSNPSTWNNHTHSTNLYPEHISANTITTVGEVGPGAIRINIGEGVTDANNTYLYEKLIIDSTGSKEIGTNGNKHKPNFSHLSAGLGTALHDMGNGFRVSPDIATSYGASLWRIITMSYMRRAVMTQNALDSLMKKNFRSDLSKYAQKDKEIFLNRARNQRDVNNPARLNRYSPAMRKAMKQDKSTKRKSRTDKAFLDYGGNKNHIAFVLPYAAHSYAELGVASAIEWAGGMIGGVQRQLGDGILGGYLGYEYAYVDAELLRSQATVHNNSLNIGATYFQSFAFETKPQEAYIKLNARAGLDMPIFEAQSPLPNIKFKLETNTPDSAIPLIWSAGASLRSGINFYQLKYNSYIAPELGVSYDVLSPLDMKLQKAKYKLGGNEYYPMQMWHLPQVSASVKYYKVWGKRFKMSAIGGLRYNVLNKPTGEFKIGGLSGTGTIALPILYGNVDLDLIWTLKQNHELSAGYNGLFYSNFNEFGNASENDRFHGVSTAFNMKYVYWFGGKS